MRITVLFYFLLALLFAPVSEAYAQHGHGRKAMAFVSGRVTGVENGRKESVGFATVRLKHTDIGAPTDADGLFYMKVPAGEHTLVVSAMGFKTVEKKVTLTQGQRTVVDITMKHDTRLLEGVTVTSTGVSRMKRSAFNAVAIDTRELQNTTKNLSEALSKAPGIKLREAGGVGSDMQLMLDGFSGKNVKIFIDGVPQEGVGSSFGLNNIPVNFAERIEVYKGVVPVGFGTDAMGGVINVVTNKKRRSWFVDASYSFGSFNTHKSYINFGQTLKNGFTYEINAFQNYSDNNYYIDADHVEQWKNDGSTVITDEKFHVRRFNDTYHNEAVSAKIGFVDKKWADRLMLGFTYSNMYKDIQTGVRQHTVFGEKHRKSNSLMPSLEYRKRNIFTKGLDAVLTANYNRNATTNVDTARYVYNWFGEKKLKQNGRGEQSEQFSRADNDNWNATLTMNYRIGESQTITFNEVWNAFNRSNTSLLTGAEIKDEFAKKTDKNIVGLSYRLMPNDTWNVSVFGKHYYQHVSGPIATDNNATDFVTTSRTVSSFGYGAAGTYFILPELQVKLSYEKAYRLPTIEEMFGDEDLESGRITIRPENSDNMNLNLSWAKNFGRHSVYVEGGLVYRNTKDYIQRNIQDLSGGRENATYINYGKVVTKGLNLSARYSFGPWVSVGGNFTKMDVRDMEKYQLGSNGTSTPNLTYNARMANVPYMFADSDISLRWPGLGGNDNSLTLTYDNQYLHSFCYNSEVIGTNSSEYTVPNQFAHNLQLSYSIHGGRYNVSLECRNMTNARLYDNFSLQKAGRAFYGKVRVYFGK